MLMLKQATSVLLAILARAMATGCLSEKDCDVEKSEWKVRDRGRGQQKYDK